MTVHLLDVNVLIALTWPSHIHHESVHRWFSSRRGHKFATCPITQCGFIRISANPKIIPEAVSVAGARDHLQAITAHPDHVFWEDSIDITREGGLPINLMGGYRQVTDAYLVSLAFHMNGRLATLDHRLSNALQSTSFYDTVVLIPIE